MSKPSHKKHEKKRLLIDVIKEELRARGYVEVEPNPEGGGQWSPANGAWSDSIIEAVKDCFDEEANK